MSLLTIFQQGPWGGSTSDVLRGFGGFQTKEQALIERAKAEHLDAREAEQRARFQAAQALAIGPTRTLDAVATVGSGPKAGAGIRAMGGLRA